jgi:hypothetical protein
MIDGIDMIIVAHNAGDLLEAAVASALPDVPESNIFISDTETTDGSIERVHARHPAVTVTYVGPFGCSAGNNASIKVSTSPYVLLLNPDAEIKPGSLAKLVAYADAHPRVGIVGSTILNPDGTVQANSYGRFPSLVSLVGLRFWRMWQTIRGNTRMSPRRLSRPTSVDWATGAGFLVRRKAIDEVGPMDSGFFLYFEDIEWCHRMHDGGWDVVVEPAAEVVHDLGNAGGGSSPEAVAAYRVSFYRYCKLYHLRGLAFVARIGLTARRATGGRA